MSMEYIWGPSMPYCPVHLTPSWAASCMVELGQIWSSGYRVCSELLPATAWDILIFLPLLTDTIPVPRRSCLWQDGSLSNLCRQVTATHLLVGASRGEKQLCIINPNVLIEQCDPRKAGQGELSTAGAEGASPCLVLCDCAKICGVG